MAPATTLRHGRCHEIRGAGGKPAGNRRFCSADTVPRGIFRVVCGVRRRKRHRHLGPPARPATASGAIIPSSPTSASSWRRSGRKYASISWRAIPTVRRSTGRNARSPTSAPKGALDERPSNPAKHLRRQLRVDQSFDRPLSPRRPRLRVTVGGADCRQPYALSLFNISAMSFGALSANAIRALNHGASWRLCPDTGEGGISRYHREFGGDLIWEIGSGYFGCRNEDGSFCPDRFAAHAQERQVKMVEIKLSQGAKPGHGGVLPGAKVTAEIANARGVPMGVDCISPARHPAFKTPIELMHFIALLRDLLAASRSASSSASATPGSSWRSARPCSRPEFARISSSSTARRAEPAQRRSNSSITSARRCEKAWCWRTTASWEPDCGTPSALVPAVGW